MASCSFVPSLPIIICLVLLLSLNSGGGILEIAHGQTSGQWCVAKPSTSGDQLSKNINYACSNGVDCSIIQDGGPCYSPDCPVNHASVVMNLYYQMAGRHYWNCDFNNSAIIAVTDPSYDSCRYEYDR